MEIAVNEKVNSWQNRGQSSSFDCDSSAMDGILGLNSLASSDLRLDCPQLPLGPKNPIRESRVCTPLEFIAADRKPDDSWCLESDSMTRKQARLLRLLDRQQSWYDAQQQAALAAEQLLSLCEHHQQQCLPSNQQTHQAQPVNLM